MNYQLSETEFYRLVDCVNQLDFITGLCCHIEGSTTLSIDGLQSFLHALREPLQATIKTAGERLEAELVLHRAALAAAPEPIVTPPVTIAPELLIGLMDAASGAITDSDALLGLWDKLYDASVEHRPYDAVSHHFLDVLQSKGLSLRIAFEQGECTRAFIESKPRREPPARPGTAKPRKRERLTATA